MKIKKRFGHLDDVDDEIAQRFGEFSTVKHQHTLWFHVVSVGETNAAQPLIEHYLRQGQTVLISNTTRTGQAQAKKLFAEKYADLVQMVYLPIDQVSVMQKFLQHFQPKILLLMETELWPNLIYLCRQQNIPQILLNARLSAKSAKGYGKSKRLTYPMLQQLNFIAAQDAATQQRYIELGMPEENIAVLGNVKFDITAPNHFLQQAEKLREQWQLQNRKIIILASTHQAEEQEIVRALKQYLEQDAQALCIVVPRHPERFNDVYQQLIDLSLVVHRRSLQQTIQTDTQIYLADSMGELWLWYALSDVAYVGGSLNATGGGHNILEPIALNIATVVGEKYFNFQTIVDAFVENKGIIVVNDAEQAADHLWQLLQHSSQAIQQKQRANQILQANQGAVDKHIAVIDKYMSFYR
ncbi:3-deoxy-D-manno-octulosonic acid transferase [Acinetobacter sp. c1-l78]|uniref:3-deoxy-D-manno-octulosonic acid transferase n=1 Tax=Acinetobacter sp. c1-l78 TaxID=3342803 RepID=UPI0035BB6C3F